MTARLDPRPDGRGLAVTRLEDRTNPVAVGGLDPAFGTAGVATAPGDVSAVVAVNPTLDGKILVVGNVGGGVSVARLLHDGRPDASFGTGGRLVVAAPAGKTLEAVAAVLVPGGDVLIFGAGTSATDTDSAVVQVSPAGAVSGPLFFDVSDKAGAAGKADYFTGVAFHPTTGDAYVVGTATNAVGGTDLAVTRFGAGFTVLGTALVDVGGAGRPDTGLGVAVSAGGRVYLSGFTVAADPPGPGAPTDFAVARLDADLTNPVSKAVDLGGDVGGEVAVNDAGEVFVVGTSSTPLTGSDFAVVRFDADLNVQKIGVVDFGGMESAARLALDAFGRVVVFGSTGTPASPDRPFAVARLLPDSLAPDPVFDGDGKQVVAVAGADTTVRGALLSTAGGFDGTGQLLVAGRTTPGAAAVARLGATVGLPTTVLATGPDNGRLQLLAQGTTTGVGLLRAVGDPFDGYPGVPINVRPGIGDVNGDAVAELIVGTGVGVPPAVTIVNGQTNKVLAVIAPFEEAFTGGVFVSVADLTGDGLAEVIISPDRGGGPVVAIYDGAKLASLGKGEGAELVRFLGIDDGAFRGGARPAVGDVTGDGAADLVVAAGFLGGPRITIWDGLSIRALAPRQLANFFAFEDSVRNGAFVSVGDVTGDGVADVAFGGGPGGAPRVRVFNGVGLIAAAGTFQNVDEIAANQVANFFAGDTSLRGGVRLSLRDLDGDAKADLVAGSGEGEAARVRVYAGARLVGEPAAADQALDLFGGAVLPNGVFVG